MMKINFRTLNGNALKIIGAVSMFIDHVGVLFFPRVLFLRIIGRLAFPIFAYLITEGCRHTKNKLKYFLNLAVFGVIFQLVYFLITESRHMNIFITYALSIPMIYSFQHLKNSFGKKGYLIRTGAVFSLFASILFAIFFHKHFSVDYGFVGTLVPFVSSISMNKGHRSEVDRMRDHIFSVLFCGISLIVLAYPFRGVQIYGLLALPLLLAYSGERGKANLKYFFYLFYPAHLVILCGIKELLNLLS